MPQDDAPPGPMMTTDEAASLLRRTPETIRAWVVDGTLQGAKVGGRVLVSRASVDALVAKVVGDQDIHTMRVDRSETMHATATPYRNHRRGAR